ncbi:hypothetical protein QL285_065267 [Trifolium repens]|nr:hypothetical protein QL285_065267 [Trifolium repens]
MFFRRFGTSTRRRWVEKEIYVLTNLQKLYNLLPTDYTINSVKEMCVSNQFVSISKRPLKMRMDAERVFGADSVASEMQIPWIPLDPFSLAQPCPLNINTRVSHFYNTLDNDRISIMRSFFATCHFFRTLWNT